MNDGENNNQKVSIIIPAYNSSSTIEQCLEAVFRQDYPFVETIVVDDKSTNDTIGKVSKFPAIVIGNPVNSGAAYSRNRGAERASSEILIFVDSDVVIPTDGVSRIYTTLLEKPNCRIIAADYSENTRNLNFISDFKNLDIVYRSMNNTYTKYCGSHFMAIRKPDFTRAGGFTEDFKGCSNCEDIDFGLKVTEGKNLVYVDRAIKVDHLKRYGLLSMLRTDVGRISGIMRIARSFEGRLVPEGRGNSRMLINVLLSLSVLPLAACCFIVPKSYIALLAVGAAFVANNGLFLRYLVTRRGILFAFASIPVLFAEYHVVGLTLLVESLRRVSRLPLIFGRT